MLYPDEIAVKDINGEYTYFQLYLAAKRLAIQISNICGDESYICLYMQKCIVTNFTFCFCRKCLFVECDIPLLQ